MTPRDLARAYVDALGTDYVDGPEEALENAIALSSGLYASPDGTPTTRAKALALWRRAARRTHATRGAPSGPRVSRVWLEVLVTERDAARLRRDGEGVARVWGVKGGEVGDE